MLKIKKKIISKPRAKKVNGFSNVDFLSQLSQNDRYAVYSAVRGPDRSYYSNPDGRNPITLGLSGFKELFTGRIRVIVFPEGHIPGVSTHSKWTDADTTHLIENMKQVKALKAAFVDMNGYNHYVEHLRLAITKTETHKLWGGKAQEILGILKTTYSL